MTQAIVLLRSWLIILIYSIYYRLECIYCTFAAWMCAETHRVFFRYTIWAFTVNNNDHFWYETVNFMFFAVVVVCSGVQLYCICVESQLERHGIRATSCKVSHGFEAVTSSRWQTDLYAACVRLFYRTVKREKAFPGNASLNFVEEIFGNG